MDDKLKGVRITPIKRETPTLVVGKLVSGEEW
jgi:hypothetical protein